jgi:hypothetical protein
MKIQKFSVALTVFFVVGCASEPKNEKPAWLQQPTRIVDNGYIVYVGSAEELSPDKAMIKAEGVALEDLANECSFIPKGARIEDRFQEKDKSMTKAYVKVGLEFTECEKAKRAVDPAAIKEIANVAFAEQLKKYQDLSENGEIADSSEYKNVPVPAQNTPLPERASMAESTHFYVVRQYVAYQKEIVILSPPTAYASNSAETQRFTAAVQPANAQIQNYETKNPELAKNPAPWSKVPDRPAVAHPWARPKSDFKPVPASAHHQDRHGKKEHPAHESAKGSRKKKRRH